MSGDFARVRAVAARSRASRVVSTTTATVQAAWRSSAVGGWLVAWTHRLSSASPAERVRWAATAIAVAAGAHLILRSVMPPVLAPALPAPLVVAVAGWSAIMAWKASAVATAWRRSRLSRLFDRATAHDAH
jgi:hypothetical protein